MKKLLPNFCNTTTSIFIFLTLIIFSCQDVTSNIDPLKQYKTLTSASQLEPDSVAKIDIMKNRYFKLFSDIKDGFYFGQTKTERPLPNVHRIKKFAQQNMRINYFRI